MSMQMRLPSVAREFSWSLAVRNVVLYEPRHLDVPQDILAPEIDHLKDSLCTSGGATADFGGMERRKEQSAQSLPETPYLRHDVVVCFLHPRTLPPLLPLTVTLPFPHQATKH